MSTSNTIEDLNFAEMHLDYAARRSPDQIVRAEAQTVLGIVRQLDHFRPKWKLQLLSELADRNITHELQSLLLVKLDSEDLMDRYLSLLVNISDI